MFWGITLDVGKRYTQTVEKSFHLSMAALGFNNTTADPVTIMVEVDKAQFALCTLQPGRIPQQTLDIAFTEGEEITFYTEGNNEVHLTGYLVEEPETIEMDDEDFSIQSDESVSGSDESASDSNKSEDEENDVSSSNESVTLQHLLVGENVSDDDDQSDNDWDPSRDNPSSKAKNKSAKKSQKNKKKETQNAEPKEENVSNGAAVQQSDGLATMLWDDSLDSADESNDYIPEKKKKEQESAKKQSPKKKGKKRKLKESTGSEITRKNEPEKEKKSKKRTSKIGSDS